MPVDGARMREGGPDSPAVGGESTELGRCPSWYSSRTGLPWAGGALGRAQAVEQGCMEGASLCVMGEVCGGPEILRETRKVYGKKWR